MNDKGSTLVLLVIVMTIIIALGVSILDIAMMQYNIKKYNTEAKQSFYMSETGLNEAFVDAYKLIGEATEDSLIKAEEYLLLFPLNESEAESIFKANYKLYITVNLRNRVLKSSNPAVEVTNENPLVFVDDMLTANVMSKYNSVNIEKITFVDLIILVPGYYYIKNNVFDISDYIMFDNWS